jgi:hypothetical protein
MCRLVRERRMNAECESAHSGFPLSSGHEVTLTPASARNQIRSDIFGHRLMEAPMSLTRARIALLLAFVTGCASTSVVTTPSPVPPAGTAIRYALSSDSSRLIEGRLISLDADTLAFERFVPERPAYRERAHWAAERIPTDSITLLQTKVRQGTQVGQGALIGGGIGFAVGLLCAAGSDESNFAAPSAGQCLASGVLSGVAIGALIGAVSHKDAWAPVLLPAPPLTEPLEAPVTAAAEVDPE